MAKAGTVTLELDADSVRLINELQKAERATRRTGRRMARDFGRAAQQIARSATLAAGAITAMSVVGVRNADNMAKFAQRIGMSVTELSRLEFAAKTAGIQGRTFEMGLQRMTRRAAEAGQGLGEAKGAIAELGLEADVLARLSPEQQFLTITKALEGVEDQGTKTRLAFKLFDSEGVALLQLMNKGTKEIEALTKKADELGVTLSEKDAKAAEHAAQKFDELGASFEGLGRSFGVNLAGPLADGVNFITQDVIPALTWAAEQIGLIQRDINALSSGQLLVLRDDLAQEVKGLRSQIADLPRQEHKTGAGSTFGERFATFYGGQMAASDVAADLQRSTLLERLDAAETRLKETEERIEKIRTDPIAAQAGGSFDPLAVPGLFNPDAAPIGSGDNDGNKIDPSDVVGAEMAGLDEALDKQKEYFEHAEKLRKDNLKKVKAAENAERNLRSDTVAQALNLLNTLAGENKAFAIAAIVVEKGLAMAQAQINTAVAVTKALSIDPYGVLAARVAAMGAVQMGLIAATGIAQVAQTASGGGASLGSASNPAFTDQENTVPDRTEATNRGAVTVNFLGDLNGWDEYVETRVIEAIRDAVDNRDVVLVSGDSRQASEIRSNGSG